MQVKYWHNERSYDISLVLVQAEDDQQYIFTVLKLFHVVEV